MKNLLVSDVFKFTLIFLFFLQLLCIIQNVLKSFFYTSKFRFCCHMCLLKNVIKLQSVCNFDSRKGLCF